MALVDLTQLGSGKEGVIRDILGGRGLMSKLSSLGIRPGVKVRKVSSQFLRGPVTIRIGNTQIAIGFGMARRIIVEVKA